MGQTTRDTNYATMPMNFRRTKEIMECQGPYRGRAPLDRTEPRLEAELMEADKMMAAETRSAGYYYRHYDKLTGEWDRRFMSCQSMLPRWSRRRLMVRSPWSLCCYRCCVTFVGAVAPIPL